MDYETRLKKAISSVTREGLKSITPGLCLQVYEKGKKRADVRLGKTYEYYDLASLTKVLFGASFAMFAEEHKNFSVTDKVKKYVPELKWSDLTVHNLLTHTSGLEWWLPFYKSIYKIKGMSKKREKLKSMLLASSRRSTKDAVYSDLDLLLLGFVFEEWAIESGYFLDSSNPLLSLWKLLPWRQTTPSFHFCLDNKPKFQKSDYAPTEMCPWRKTVLQGVVHDENTYSLGGVSNHAGLFGNIDDVSKYMLMLRQGVLGKKSKVQIASPKVVQRYTSRAIAKKRGDWALGFMMPSHNVKLPKVNHLAQEDMFVNVGRFDRIWNDVLAKTAKSTSSSGNYFSNESVGHTGFVGTSVWFDPRRDLIVVLLANRVHPTRENRKFVQLRPLIHDLVLELL